MLTANSIFHVLIFYVLILRRLYILIYLKITDSISALEFELQIFAQFNKTFTSSTILIFWGTLGAWLWSSVIEGDPGLGSSVAG